MENPQTQLRRAWKMSMNVGTLTPFFCAFNCQVFIDMIIDNDPLIERHISVPRDLSGLSCSSFSAGIVEAVLDGLGFVRSDPCFVFHADGS